MTTQVPTVMLNEAKHLIGKALKYIPKGQFQPILSIINLADAQRGEALPMKRGDPGRKILKALDIMTAQLKILHTLLPLASSVIIYENRTRAPALYSTASSNSMHRADQPQSDSEPDQAEPSAEPGNTIAALKPLTPRPLKFYPSNTKHKTNRNPGLTLPGQTLFQMMMASLCTDAHQRSWRVLALYKIMTFMVLVGIPRFVAQLMILSPLLVLAYIYYYPEEAGHRVADALKFVPTTMGEALSKMFLTVWSDLFGTSAQLTAAGCSCARRV